MDNELNLALSSHDVISLNIAIEKCLDHYKDKGYTDQDIETAPEGSLFGDLRILRDIFNEHLYGE